MTKVIGLTGGIATGKSTADDFFIKKNIPVIDADEVAHHIYDVGKPAWQNIRDSFGEIVLNPDQTINRQQLGKIVFDDKAKLNELNQITHPLIRQDILSEIAKAKRSNQSITILDVPLLFESSFDQICDEVIVISLPEHMQLERLMKRNHISQKDALARIHSQMPTKEKEARASYVVYNTGTIEELNNKLEKILLVIKQEG